MTPRPPPASLPAEPMRPADEVLWNVEVDPVLRSTVVAVALLDRPPDQQVVLARVAAAVGRLDRLRRRVDEPRLPLAAPRWVDGGDLDLEHHVRRLGVPAPGTLREVLDLAALLGAEPFDVSRPLWELVVVEGLADGGAALIQKFHHSLMDGEGAVALGRLLLDPDDPLAAAAAATRPPDLPATAEVASPTVPRAMRAVGSAVASATSGVLVSTRHTAAAGLRSIGHPLASMTAAHRLAISIGRAVAPVPESRSRLLRGRGPGRRYDTIDVRLADLRAAGHAVGGTVNDAFLAAVVGGLAGYHTAHGEPVDELRLTMPVSVRTAADEPGGNRFAPVRFTVPTGIADPRARIAHLGEIARTWQHEPFLEHTDAIATVLARLPKPVTASLFGGMLKHVDAVATNVAGLSSPARLGGARIVREYAFAPPTGAAVNVSLLSHVDQACIGVVVDTRAVPDDVVLIDALVTAFDDVISVADHHARRTG